MLFVRLDPPDSILDEGRTQCETRDAKPSASANSFARVLMRGELLVLLCYTLFRNGNRKAGDATHCLQRRSA